MLLSRTPCAQPTSPSTSQNSPSSLLGPKPAPRRPVQPSGDFPTTPTTQRLAWPLARSLRPKPTLARAWTLPHPLRGFALGHTALRRRVATPCVRPVSRLLDTDASWPGDDASSAAPKDRRPRIALAPSCSARRSTLGLEKGIAAGRRVRRHPEEWRADRRRSATIAPLR